MQPLIVLSAAFAFLVTYLEYGVDMPPPTQAEYVAAAAVVRDNHEPVRLLAARTAPTRGPAVKQTTPSRKPVKLDLALPEGVEAAATTAVPVKGFAIDLFEPRQHEGISYEAELVFDRETGEDITGGKVNIRIPLT